MSSRTLGRNRACRLAAAGLLALAGMVTAGQPARAAYLGSDGLIAFVRSGNIYTINPESSSPATTVVRLTRDGRDSGPRWSPDGKQIAYLDGGNLWVMDANGSHKTRVTSQAPAYTDARPTWSPSGRYIAFVRTARHAKYGYLTRYDTVVRKFVTFSMPYHSEQPTRRQVSVTARPAPVAWARALNATGVTFGWFIVFEGATAPACLSGRFCLDALGFAAEADYRNGLASSENRTKSPVRQLDPDWYPIRPRFGVDVLTTQENCSGAACSPAGIDLTPAASPILPGGYEAVYAPNAVYIAFVEAIHRVPEIFIYNRLAAAPQPTRELTWGTEPDWQPVPPFPPGG